MRRKILAVTLTALATTGLALVPTAANAAGSSTNVTFTLAGSGLSISAPTGSPTAVALTPAGSLGLGGTSVSGQLGNTTVTDARGLAAGGWSVVMTSTAFSDGAGHTIAAASGSGYSGAVVSSSGTVVPVPTLSANPLQNLDAGTGATIMTATGVLGSSSVTYNPTVSVAIAADVVAGTYTGVVTQTVS